MTSVKSPQEIAHEIVSSSYGVWPGEAGEHMDVVKLRQLIATAITEARNGVAAQVFAVAQGEPPLCTWDDVEMELNRRGRASANSLNVARLVYAFIARKVAAREPAPTEVLPARAGQDASLTGFTAELHRRLEVQARNLLLEWRLAAPPHRGCVPQAQVEKLMRLYGALIAKLIWDENMEGTT